MLAGMSGCDLCLLPWIPSLSVVSQDELSEVFTGDSERGDPGDGPAAHSADHLPLLHRETGSHQAGRGRNTDRSHSVFLLVSPPDVHLPPLPQTLSHHQGTQAHDCGLVALSPRQYCPGLYHCTSVTLSVSIRQRLDPISSDPELDS